MIQLLPTTGISASIIKISSEICSIRTINTKGGSIMIQPITEKYRQQVMNFFRKHWGGSQMIISSGTYDCAMLDGYVYVEEAAIIGLVTYVIHGNSLEIISLDSIREGNGIGSRLMAEVEQFAVEHAIPKIELITTNDNLQALKFYQKRGYRITHIFPNAVMEARKVKPTIPLIGNEGIPLHDELKLQKKLVDENSNNLL